MILSQLYCCAALKMGRTVAMNAMNAGMSRRSWASAVVKGAALGALVAPQVSLAEVEEVPLSRARLGGILEPYSDIQRGFRIMAPYSWNKFENGDGYDVRWMDLVNPKENVLLRSSAVKSDASLDKIGTPEEVGKKLASSREAQVVKSSARKTENLIFYDFEFVSDKAHELCTLCINRNKLYSLSAVTTPKAWGKRQDAYEALVKSFIPKV